MIYFPGGDDPSALNLNATKWRVCPVGLKEIFVFFLVPCLPVLPADTVQYEASGRRELVGMTGVLRDDSTTGVDRHRMSALRVPSESNAGGLYKDVFLQITHWANIQKLSAAWQAGHPSVLRVPRCQSG